MQISFLWIFLILFLLLSCTQMDVDQTRDLAVDCLLDAHYPPPPWYLNSSRGPWPPWAIWSGDHECESVADAFRDAVYDAHSTDDPRIRDALETLERAYKDRLSVEFPEVHY